MALDVIRGVAAAAVVAYHMDDGIIAGLCPHGYLAVDVFFVLSGFVLAHAYGVRLSCRRVSWRAFMRERLTRLMPTMALGMVLGFVLTLSRMLAGLDHASMVDMAIALVFGVALVPILWTTTLGANLFPFDGPAWSLFSEVAVNALWGWTSRRGDGRVLLTITALCGAAGVALGCHHFGDGAFGATPGSFGVGLSRVAYSFPVGVGLYAWRHRVPAVPLPAILFVVAAFLMAPALGRWDAVWDAFFILAVSPAIVLFANGTRLDGPFRAAAVACGALSYPVYALHGPILEQTATLLHRTGAGPGLHVAAGCCAVCLILAGAWCTSRWYDGLARGLLASLFADRTSRA